jgi:hypothetical protein
MSIKVLASKVLGFKCVLVTSLTFLKTHLVPPWRMMFTPFSIGLLYSWDHLWASIKLLDVNEVAIIMIILRELQHPIFIDNYIKITRMNIVKNFIRCS